MGARPRRGLADTARRSAGRLQGLAGEPAAGDALEVTVRYLTPHSKWSIHSEFQDNLLMLTLFRGGPAMWLSVGMSPRTL